MAVKLNFNEEHQGLELFFSEKPSRDVIDQMKEQGFRWHNKKKLWFAKDTKPRREFAEQLADHDTLAPAVQAQPSAAEMDQNEGEKKSNTFAAHYDAIGDARILDSSNVSLLSCKSAYFKDLNCGYGCTYSGDSLFFTDLTNAGKAGKTCKTWRLYPENYRESVTLELFNKEKIESCEELYEALKSGRKFESIKVSEREEKAVDVFSPFQEVKPLKALPEKWTKRNFAQAVLSGQVFRGEVAYRYTDDYAYDAAYNYGTGTGIYMPRFARDVIEDWGSLTSVHIHDSEPDQDGIWTISYSEYSNSCKTLWFDLNCDIGEGKRRAEERQAGLERYNKMMEDSCITLSANAIEPGKLYQLQLLSKNGNTGRYGVKEENIPGYVLQGRIEEGYVDQVLSASLLEIQPDQLYEVSNFFHHPNPDLLMDDRVIDCGNCKCVVFGKALLELIGEKKYCSIITPATGEYCDFIRAEATLQEFVNGNSRFFGQNAPDYAASLSKLRSEYQRSTGQKSRLDETIKAATERAVAQTISQGAHAVSFER